MPLSLRHEVALMLWVTARTLLYSSKFYASGCEGVKMWRNYESLIRWGLARVAVMTVRDGQECSDRGSQYCSHSYRKQLRQFHLSLGFLLAIRAI